MFKNFNQISVKFIAIFDGGKGLLVLFSVSLFIFVYHSDAHALAAALIKQFHIDPNSNYPHKLLMLAANVTPDRLIMICVCAYLYSAIKISEAYGLWRDRQWGRTVGILSVGVLVPFELYELFYQYTHTKLTVLLINIAIVVILFFGFGRNNTKL